MLFAKGLCLTENALGGFAGVVTLKALLSILNSKTGRFWIMNRAKKRGVGYDISVSVINRFPVKAEWLHGEKLINAVDQSLAAKKTKPSVGTFALESQIGEKVFDLYGLEKPERDIIRQLVN